MKTNKILIKLVAPAAAAIVLCGATASAATLVNTGTGADGAGELFVAFHATGGQGNGQSVVIDLGAVSAYAAVPIGGALNFSAIPGHNVGANLTSVFGSSWYDRTDLLWSAVSAVQSTIPSTSTDLTSTLYGSVASPVYNPTVGHTATAWNRDTNSGQNPVAQKVISNMVLSVGGFTDTTTGNTVGATTNIAIETASAVNGYATWMPGGGNVAGLGGTAFGGFTSPNPAADFEQAFAPGQIAPGVEGALDVFRMYRSNGSDPEATPATGTGPGSYQFTLTIDQSGNITGAVLPVPEPASISLLMAGGIFFLVSRRRGTGAFARAASNV